MPEAETRVEQEKELMVWSAPSRPFKKRGDKFLTVPLVIAVLVGIILILAGEWIMVGVVASVMFAYYVWSTVAPDDIEYKLTTRGIRVGGQLFSWETMDRWWEENKWGHKLVMVSTFSTVAGRLTLLVDEAKYKKIGEIMDGYLLREKPAETKMDKMSRWLEEKFPLQERG